MYNKSNYLDCNCFFYFRSLTTNGSKISFCKVGAGGSKRASIRNNCDEGWSELITLYGLNASLMNTIKVKHLWYLLHYATSRLSLNENYEAVSYGLSNQIPYIYLPGKKLYIVLYFSTVVLMHCVAVRSYCVEKATLDNQATTDASQHN